jgi:predicted metal-dependent phosphoesterase TrpH
MKTLCDLHTHSVFSDGTYTPEQIIDAAVSMGLGAVALTDHNTVDGLEIFTSYARGKDIIAVPGAEFSTGYGKKELHILALFIKPESYGEVKALTDGENARKEQSNIRLAEALCADGYIVDYQKIKLSTPKGHVNRAHFAEELMKNGYVKSIEEAFATVLSSKNKYYVPPKRLGAFEAISFIRSIGALPVLAHPFLNLNEQELRAFIPEAKKHGLVGMETVYSKYTAEEEALARAIAHEYSLEESGGSDFHGAKKPSISLGKGLGDMSVPMELYRRLASI